MKRLCSIIGMLILVCLIGCEDELPEPSEPIGSRVELAAGDVWLVEGKEKQRLITGAMLLESSDIEVSESGRALLKLGNGASVFLRGGTSLSLRRGEVSLKKGEIWADVPADDKVLSRFKTGSTVVTASDTGFDLMNNGAETTVYVARGLAVVGAAGGRVEVQSGERVVIKGKAKPAVEPVDFFDDWTGGMADKTLVSELGGKGSGKIFGIEPLKNGAVPSALQIVSQQVKVMVRDGVAHTTVDQRFFNPASQDLEGWYWFTVPEQATVNQFALEVNGELVEGEIVERKQAKAAYEEAVRNAFDPALLEWIDGRTYRARIFPIPSVGERRVVLSYTEMLPTIDNVKRYLYPMGGENAVQIQEFSLTVDLGDDAEKMEVATLQDARVEQEGKIISMRRSGYVPRSDFLLEMREKEKEDPLQVRRFSSSSDEADYVMLRYFPDVAWGKITKIPGDVVVVLDTSAGGHESERQIRMDVVEAILRALSDEDRFAVVAADLSSRVVYPAKGLAQAKEANVQAAMEGLSEVSSAGATDLGNMLGPALGLLHAAEQPAVVYVGDGRATVGETTSDELTERMRRSLGDSRARFFTIAVGDGADFSLLERLARVGGGRSFRVDVPEQTVGEALKFVGMLKTPTITDLEINVGSGLDQPFMTASKKLSKGSEAVLFARTHHPLPSSVTVTGRLGGKDFKKEYSVDEQKGGEYAYVAMLWAGAYLQRLMGEGAEAARGKIISLGLNYGLMTPFSSFLVLESNAAYEAQGIQRRRRFTSIFSDAPKIAAADTMGIPLMLFGCSEKHADEKSVPAQTAEWLKVERRDEVQGGKGKRHKGEEGQMGKRDSRKTDNHYGIKGPRDNPAPAMAEEPIVNKISRPKKRRAQKSELDDLLGGSPAKGSGAKEGTIGLGNLNTIGHGGGGGTGSGYGRGAGGLAGSRSKAVRIRSGNAQVKGSLSKEVIRRIVHRHINEVKFCYKKAFNDDITQAGQVNVNFVINDAGSVLKSSLESSTFADDNLGHCVRHAVRRWQFPKPEGGGVVLVNYPFKFGAGEIEPVNPIKKPQPVRRPAYAKNIFGKGICSDASTRPLSHRRILWQRRIHRADSVEAYNRVFFEAGKKCELPRWRDRRVFLDIIESKIRTPQEVQELLAAFDNYAKLKKYLKKRIMRRSLDPDMTMGVYFDSTLNWSEIARGLAAYETDAERIAELKKIVAQYPDDSSGRSLLVQTLYNAGENKEALIHAKRLKADGMAGPSILRIMCDLQKAFGNVAQARRLCSELVEFNAEDVDARMKTGDIFLRHGWYKASYRQYKTLVDAGNEDPMILLRLAAAAAGMGKVDEALRLERKVASGDGESGPSDPRLFARLLSVARLSNMILAAKKVQNDKKQKALIRSLKRTQVFSTPATYKILVWEDLEVAAELIAKQNEIDFPVASKVWAPKVGLAMLELGQSVPADVKLELITGAAPVKRQVTFALYTIVFDGKTYAIDRKEIHLKSGETELALN